MLVHGGRDHARSWDAVAQDLRRDYHVIALDLRGHGDSAWAIGSLYHIAEMVIYVIVASELLRQASVSPSRLDLATYWVNRKMLDVELNAKRVIECGAERIERFEGIIELFE